MTAAFAASLEKINQGQPSQRCLHDAGGLGHPGFGLEATLLQPRMQMGPSVATGRAPVAIAMGGPAAGSRERGVIHKRIQYTTSADVKPTRCSMLSEAPQHSAYTLYTSGKLGSRAPLQPTMKETAAHGLWRSITIMWCRGYAVAVHSQPSGQATCAIRHAFPVLVADQGRIKDHMGWAARDPDNLSPTSYSRAKRRHATTDDFIALVLGRVF